MEVQIIHFAQCWNEDTDFARVVASSRHLTRFGEGEMARTYTGTRSVRKQRSYVCAQSTLKITKLATKVGTCSNSNWRKPLVVWTTRFTRKQWWCSINPLLIERRLMPTNVVNYLRPNHQLERNHGQTDHGIKEMNHGKVTGNTTAGDIHKNCGTNQDTTIGNAYLRTTRSFTGDRWTQLTQLVNIMTQTTFTQSNSSDSSAVVNSSFSSMSKRARESFATSASAKQKRVHCEKNSRRGGRHGLPRSNSTRISSWSRLQAWTPVSARLWKG